jgi:DNA-binding transcriptional ArsR family regulator
MLKIFMEERGIEDAVVMDQKTFKSLTSETRTDILKLLKKRNHTLSEIAEALKISKTTAKEHLDVLMEGRLIEQVPSTNIWKYYTLTNDGKKLVGEAGPKRVVILLGTFILGIILSLYGAFGLIGYGPAGGAIMEAPAGYETNAKATGLSSYGNASISEAQKNEETAAIDMIKATPAEPKATETRALQASQNKSDFPLLALVAGLSIAGISLAFILKGNRNKAAI